MKFKPLTLPNRIRAGLVVMYLQKENRWKRFINISAFDWMLRVAGRQVTEVIWEPLLKGKFDKYYNKVSMAWLWARIHIRAQSREAGGEKLGYFDGGFQVLTDALVSELNKMGVEIKSNYMISSIGNNSDERVVVVANNGAQSEYDACIVTTPSHVFAKLIASNDVVKSGYLRQLESINYLGAKILIFSSDQDLSPYYWHNINDISLPFLVFINHTKLIDKKQYNNKYIYYVATYLPVNHELFTLPDSELKTLWFTSLHTIFPKFNINQVSEDYCFTFANAQHIVDLDYENKIPKKRTPLKNVYLSNFSQIFPEDRGTNFAVRDGLEIAEMLIEDLHKNKN
jgi:protoporphyrinogen oxidase